MTPFLLFAAAVLVTAAAAAPLARRQLRCERIRSRLAQISMTAQRAAEESRRMIAALDELTAAARRANSSTAALATAIRKLQPGSQR